MQEFKPDCIINLHMESRGKPGKYAWSCSLVDRSGRRLVTAVKFAGVVSRDAVLLESARFGLVQAQRLRMEKIEVASDGSIEGFLASERVGSKRVRELQSLLDDVIRAWSSFRLRKIGSLAGAERDFLHVQAGTAFKR